MGKLVGFWIMIYILFVLKKWDVRGFGFDNSSNSPDAVSFWESMSMSESAYGVSATAAPATNNALMVGLTLVQGAAAEGAVCLDGSSPGYHLHRGSGTGTDNWLIHLEGGGWCNNIRSCKYRAKTFRGSSNKFEKSIPFTGILSNKSNENPDFFNWNRVKIRYCDGASFSGDSENKDEKLHFRGRRIWKATMKELLSKGMKNAKQTLLSGCSAGGLASILHCDKFRNLFPKTTRVKCLSDAGLFLDAADVSGGRTLRRFFRGVVRLQGVGRTLTGSCPKNLTRTSCFFPQNLIAHIKTPLFILNAAYDSWQVQQSLAPETADPNGKWQNCKMNIAECSTSQKRILQGFRNQMVNATKGFTALRRTGLFLDSCFAHCQSERQGTWFDHGSPTINKKSIAVAVGDWYFDRKNINEAIDREDCSSTCHNLVFH